jgi:hypothetical protein
MRRRWSDAQYTGRYLRRTIVHGKGEHRPDRYGGSGGTENEKMPALGWIMIISVIVGLIVLKIVSTPLFCIAMVILIFLVMALT